MKIKLKLLTNNFPVFFLSILSIILSSLIITTVFLSFQRNKQKEEITGLKSEVIKLQKEKEALIEEQTTKKKEEIKIPTDGRRQYHDCTITVKKLEDIQPIVGCLFTDITLKDFPINGKNNTIHAIYTQLTNEYDYSLDIFLNEKEVKNNPLAKKIFNNGEIPSLKYYRFIPITDDSDTQGIYVFGDRAAQGPIEDIIVINSLGEVVLTDTEVAGVFPEYDAETKTFLQHIKTQFEIERQKVPYPMSFCDTQDLYTSETIVTEYNTYILVDNKVKHLKKEEITYGEILSECDEYNPID